VLGGADVGERWAGARIFFLGGGTHCVLFSILTRRWWAQLAWVLDKVRLLFRSVFCLLMGPCVWIVSYGAADYYYLQRTSTLLEG